MAFLVKKIIKCKNFNLYYFFEDQIQIGSFVIDDSDNIICLEEFEILEEFQGKGFGNKMAEYLKIILDKEFIDRICEIQIIPYGSERLNKESLKEFYLKIFTGSIEVGPYKIHYMN